MYLAYDLSQGLSTSANCFSKGGSFLTNCHFLCFFVFFYFRVWMQLLTVQGWALLSVEASDPQLRGGSAEQWSGSAGHHLWKTQNQHLSHIQSARIKETNKNKQLMAHIRLKRVTMGGPPHLLISCSPCANLWRRFSSGWRIRSSR